ncbi:MAG: class I SAM-dependent RNA methyltransferase [Polyangiales bacterium]
MGVPPSGGTELDGRVRDLTHAGEAVVETEHGIVLARGALPGERVRLRLGRRAAGVQRGVVISLLEASESRVEPACQLAERCGGCPLMALSPEAQLRFKQQRLRAMLEGLGSTLEPELVPSPSMLGYRGRARLAFRREGETMQLGYFAAGSKTLVDVSVCQVLHPALALGLTALRERLRPSLEGEGEVALGLGAGGACVAELTSRGPQPPQAYAAAEALISSGGLAGLALRIADGAAARFGDPRQVTASSDGTPLWAPAGSFRQANPEVNAMLVERVLALAEPEGAAVLELYAGHGNFTIGLAPRAKSLQAVEADRGAADACRESLRSRGVIQARVVCADAVEGARGQGGLDVVVLDPPRAGAKEVLPVVVGRRPERIVYVSCDLATLRRDLAELMRNGYALDAVTGFDMFPQTAHLETVVRLRATRTSPQSVQKR